MTSRILFVCLGNICRSPAAEAVFAGYGSAVAVDSAGTGSWHVGDPPYGAMQVAAQQRGYEMAHLRARQFVAEDFDRFDLIIAMDSQNQADIEALRPEGSGTAVRLMTSYAPELGVDAVPDPYYTRDFEGALDIVEACATGLLREVQGASLGGSA
jgi:protein-tyrosine phosphatase